MVGHPGRVAVGRDGEKLVLKIAFAIPALQAPSELHLFGRTHDGEAGGLAIGGGFQAVHAAAALFVISTDPDGGNRAHDLGLIAGGDAPAVERRFLVERAAAFAPHRNITIARLHRAREQKAAGPDARRRASAHRIGERGFGGRNAVGLAVLFEPDHAGECARSIRPRARAAHYGDAGKPFGRERRPDHPAAEGIVLRNAVQGDKRAARARGRDVSQGYALNGGVGGNARRPAKERHARRLP